jgi:hypothetical protein
VVVTVFLAWIFGVLPSATYIEGDIAKASATANRALLIGIVSFVSCLAAGLSGATLTKKDINLTWWGQIIAVGVGTSFFAVIISALAKLIMWMGLWTFVASLFGLLAVAFAVNLAYDDEFASSILGAILGRR